MCRKVLFRPFSAIRALINHHFAHKPVVRRAGHQEVPSAAQADPLHSLIERCNRRRLLAAVSELPKRERRMLKLRLNGNLELRRIAELFGVTESRVCQLVGQAVARVRSRLADA